VALARVVSPETLDGLAADDRAAIRSRRDLRRVHRVMGTRSIVSRELARLVPARGPDAPLRILEIGAGDGTLMLGVARSLGARWPRVELTLLDRLDIVARETLAGYAALGWRASVRAIDVDDWIAREDAGAQRSDLTVAVLFLHHFEGARLDALLAAIAQRTDRFFACEPRRAAVALAGSHLIGALGVNAVTREDAVLSVRAGFRERELGALWPGSTDAWALRERSAGLFSHCFAAERRARASR
jgi:hypothetical protein